MDGNYIAHYRQADSKIQTVEEHLLGVAYYTSQAARKIGLENWGYLVGLFHDLGKWTNAFNNYIMSGTGLLTDKDAGYINISKMERKLDHATAGAQYIFHSDVNKMLGLIAGVLIKSHHGGLFDCIAVDGKNMFQEKMDKPKEDTRYEEAVHNASGMIERVATWYFNQDLAQEFDEVKLELKRIKDVKNRSFQLGMTIRFLFSCLIDGDRTDTADFDSPDKVQYRQFGKYLGWDLLINRYESYISQFVPNKPIDFIRTRISTQCKEAAHRKTNIFQLTVPTGGGKTLASLRFALHHAKQNNLERIIFVVPFTTIIDQNADVVRQILETEEAFGSIVLEHHSNLTSEEETIQTKLLSENWDAPIIFTTMVQLLDTLFSGGTRGVRRMHQLAQSVIIFDEIQALDVRFIHMFVGSLSFLKNIAKSSIVLCTATQPILDRIEPNERALALNDESYIIDKPEELAKKLKRVHINDITKVGGWSDIEIIEFALEKYRTGNSILIIVNTKASAQSLMELMMLDEADVVHLSTNMCPAHRKKTLDILIKRVNEARLGDAQPIICISTQLIEAGVDVDFDIVIRFVAGLDAIIQASGRCNRNGKISDKGNVFLINPSYENLNKLKTIREGRDITERILREFKNNPQEFDGDLLSLKAMEKYYTYYYFHQQAIMNYPVTLDNGIKTDIFDLLSMNCALMKFASENYPNQQPIDLTYSFATASNKYRAIDAYQQGIVVPYGKEGKAIINALESKSHFGEVIDILKQAQRYSVNVYSYKIQQLIDSGIIRASKVINNIYILQEGYYSDIYGLVQNKETLDAIIF